MGTNYYFGDNNKFSNCQIGDDNNMYVTIHNPVSNNHWEELKSLLENKFIDRELSSNESALLHDAKNLVSKKEENNFIKFIKQNKDSLIVSTLSSLVSDGLKFLFENL